MFADNNNNNDDNLNNNYQHNYNFPDIILGTCGVLIASVLFMKMIKCKKSLRQAPNFMD